MQVVLQEIGAGGVAQLLVLNKTDIADPAVVAALQRRFPEAVAVSARTGAGVAQLLGAIGEHLPNPEVSVSLLLPFDRGDVVAEIHQHGRVTATAYSDAGTALEAVVPDWLAARVEEFAVR